MNPAPFYPHSAPRAYAGGWALSLLFHSVALTGAILFMTELTLAPRPEPFRWNVAMAQSSPSTEPATAEPSPPQPTQTQQQPRPEPQTKPQKVEPVAEEMPVERTVQREVVHRDVRQIVTQPAELVHRVSRPVEKVEEVTPVPNEATQTAVKPTPVETPPPTMSTAMPTVSQPAQTSPTQTAMVRQPEITRQPAATRESGTAQQTPVRQMPATKADYGWLVESLWNRVEQLKRYPHVARMNRWEGRVVLRAVIREDGELIELNIAESSGHSVLDRDALEILRKASPIKLKHPLGQRQVVVQIPISYRLQ